MDFATLADVITHHKDDDAKGIVFFKPDGEEHFVSYHALYHTSLRVLYNLQKHNVAPKSELVFQVHDNEHFVYIFWACILGNIIPVPLTYATRTDAREKIFKVWRYLKAPYLVIDRVSKEQFGRGDEDRVQAIESRVLYIEDLLTLSREGTIEVSHPEDIGFIQFSSGSTGDPKGVVLTHSNLLANSSVVLGIGGFNADDVWLSWMPLTHDMGLIGFHIMPTAAGGMQYSMTPAQFIADPMGWLGKADKYRASVLCSPNFGYRHFLYHFKRDQASEWDLSCIRLIFNGAEPISAQLCDTFLKTMAGSGLKRETMFTVYGLAEATLAVSFPEIGTEFRSVSIDRDKMRLKEPVRLVAPEDPKGLPVMDVGMALPGSPVRIVDNQNNPLEDYCIGNIQIKGPNVTAGYYNNPEKTSKIITSDGWLSTEDLGFMIEDHLFVTGRAKEIIFVNGTNYYAHDLEDMVQNIPGVGFGKVAALGVRNPDNSEDEIIVCLAVKRDDLNGFVDLADRVRLTISRCCGLTVTQVIPVKRIPRTTSGKPQRYRLRDAYQQGEFDTVLAQIKAICTERGEKTLAPQNQVEEQIAEIWRLLLEREHIGRSENFFDIGGTSVLAVELHIQLKELFERDFPLAMLYEHMTIAAIAAYFHSPASPEPASLDAAPDPSAEFQMRLKARRLKQRALRKGAVL